MSSASYTNSESSLQGSGSSAADAFGSTEGSASEEGTPVTLYAYDITTNDAFKVSNKVTKDFAKVGGAFHGGVEIDNKEWAYGCTMGGSGVFSCAPGTNDQHQFREAIPLGKTSKTKKEIKKILRDLKNDWLGDEYDLFRKNCCHFCEDMAQRLGVRAPPSWLNKFAKIGASLDDTAQLVAASAVEGGKKVGKAGVKGAKAGGAVAGKGKGLLGGIVGMFGKKKDAPPAGAAEPAKKKKSTKSAPAAKKLKKNGAPTNANKPAKGSKNAKKTTAIKSKKAQKGADKLQTATTTKKKKKKKQNIRIETKKKSKK